MGESNADGEGDDGWSVSDAFTRPETEGNEGCDAKKEFGWKEEHARGREEVAGAI